MTQKEADDARELLQDAIQSADWKEAYRQAGRLSDSAHAREDLPEAFGMIPHRLAWEHLMGFRWVLNNLINIDLKAG